jgi:periplasmic divalent cation tolerance protein
MLLLAYTTHATLADAQNCIAHLLQLRLVACANIMPIQSSYWWQGDIVNENEIVVLFKTRPDLKAALTNEITQIHPYQVPCIMTWEVEANEAYQKWIEEQTQTF